MPNCEHEIKPDFFFKKLIVFISLTIALAIIIQAIIQANYHFMVISLFFFPIALFTTKREMRIFNNYLQIDTIGIIPFMNNCIKIEMEEIKEIHYNKRELQLLRILIRGRSWYASPEDHRPNKNDNMIFVLKNGKTKKVFRIGKREEFKRSFEIINRKVKS